jgi:DNA-binding CsgD family transcriptional regulator
MPSQESRPSQRPGFRYIDRPDISETLADTRRAQQAFFDQDTSTRLVDYSMKVERLVSPDDVLNSLDAITSKKIRVHGAHRFFVKAGDWRRFELGKTGWFHKSVPQGWVEEWKAFTASGRYALALMTARLCLAPFTWTELSRMLDPVGIDRWPFELALKHRMRDGFVCPVGGRWAIGFWSPKILPSNFNQQARGLLYMAASAAAVRLEKLVGEDVKRVGAHAQLTARELAVLRHGSEGKSLQEIGNALGLSEETVRTHFKKAQVKLGTRNRMQTVSEAMRQLLII